MAIRLGSAYGKIEIDASGVRDGMESAQRTVSGFGDTIRSVFTFAAGQAVARGFQMLTSGMAGMAKSALDSASQLQDLGLAMETLVAREISMEQGIELTEAMEGAGEAAESLLGDLQELAIVSPFEYTTVSNVLRVQMAFGATSETAMDLTRAILNTGAAFGQSGAELDRMNYNLAQALVMGDLTGGNLRQLKIAGLDLAGVLEGELGMSIEEVRAALEDGSLTMEKVSEAFVAYTDKNFGNAAERMSKTFTGLKSSINDLWFFAGADLLTPALEVATEVLGELFDEANEIVRSGALKKVGEQLGEGLREAVMWLKDEAVPRLVEWGETFRQVTLPRIREFAKNGIEWLQTKGRALWDWIMRTAIPVLQQWGRAFVAEILLIRDFGLAFIQFALPGVKKFIKWAGAGFEWLLGKLGTFYGWVVDTAIPRLREWGKTFKTETLPRIQEFARDGIEWLQTKGKELWTWITGTAIPKLKEWGETFKTEVLPKIQEFVRDGIEWLQTKGREIWDWITVTAIPKLKEWGETFKTDVMPKVQGFIDNTLVPMWDKAKEIWDWITVTAIPKLQEWGETFKTEMLPKIQEFVDNGIDWLKQKGGEAWTWITDTAIPKLQEWGETFKTETLPKIQEFVDDGIDWLKQKGNETWMWITDTAIPKLQEWGETFKTETLPKIQEFVRDGLENLKTKGQEVNDWITTEGIPKLQEWGQAFEEGISPYTDKVKPRLEEFKNDIAPEMERLLQSLRNLWDTLGDSWDRIATLWETKISPALDKLAKALGLNTEEGDSFMKTLGEIAGATFWTTLEVYLWGIEAAVKAVTIAVDLITLSIDGFVIMLEAVVTTAESVIEIIGDLATEFEDLTGINLPDWLTPGSPTPFELGLRGIAEAIKSMPNLAASLAGGLTAPQLAPVPVGAAAGGTGGGEAPIVNFYGPITVEGVQDVPSFLEQLTKMADGR